jgi:hypothetical protein
MQQIAKGKRLHERGQIHTTSVQERKETSAPEVSDITQLRQKQKTQNKKHVLDNFSSQPKILSAARY